MAEEKKEKKNFKSVTGIKFADLIMPMLLGGIGSYSRPAGRGVEIGLQAFRTLQAGKEYSDEREMKQKVSDYFGSRVEEMEKEASMVQQDKQSLDDTSQYGFYGNKGVTLPDPNREVAEGEIQGMDVLSGKPEKLSMFSQGPQGSDIGGQLGGALPAPDMQALTDALVQKKERFDGLARDMSISDDRRHFFEMAQLGALSNPGAATYMGMQEAASRMNDKADMAKTIAVGEMWSKNNKEKAYYQAAKIRLTADAKNESARLKKELDGKFKPAGVTSEGAVKWDVENQTYVFMDRPEKRGLDGIATLPFDDRFAMWDKAARTYNMYKKSGAETGTDPGERAIMNQQKKMIADLWATMQSTEDITALMQKLNEKNQELQMAGLPPITLEQYLKSVGLEYGLNDEPLGGGEANRKNKFKLNPKGE